MYRSYVRGVFLGTYSTLDTAIKETLKIVKPLKYKVQDIEIVNVDSSLIVSENNKLLQTLDDLELNDWLNSPSRR